VGGFGVCVRSALWFGVPLSGSGPTQPSDRDRMAQGRSPVVFGHDVRDRKAMTRRVYDMWAYLSGCPVAACGRGGVVPGCRGESDFTFWGHG
jgi:hypothetical protein